jgi:hypothetical protein
VAPGIKEVFGVTGATASVSLVFIMPGMFYLEVTKKAMGRQQGQGAQGSPTAIMTYHGDEDGEDGAAAPAPAAVAAAAGAPHTSAAHVWMARMYVLVGCIIGAVSLAGEVMSFLAN